MGGVALLKQVGVQEGGSGVMEVGLDVTVTPERVGDADTVIQCEEGGVALVQLKRSFYPETASVDVGEAGGDLQVLRIPFRASPVQRDALPDAEQVVQRQVQLASHPYLAGALVPRHNADIAVELVGAAGVEIDVKVGFVAHEGHSRLTDHIRERQLGKPPVHGTDHLFAVGHSPSDA